MHESTWQQLHLEQKPTKAELFEQFFLIHLLCLHWSQAFTLTVSILLQSEVPHTFPCFTTTLARGRKRGASILQ